MKMSLNDTLANVLNSIMVMDGKGGRQIVLNHNSKQIMAVLSILQKNNYLGEIKEIKDQKGGKIEVNLLGSVNKAGVIKPRYSVKVEDYKKFEKRYLPAYGFGFLIVSTNQGMMTQEEATAKNLGGRLVAYVY